MKTYVAYYRVSTTKQGQSGLNLEAQRTALATFLKNEGNIIEEFVEIESGKRDDRIQLKVAIAFAKKNKAVLIIAKLDRLSRNANFILTLRDSGADFVCADMPDANTSTIGIFAVLAQHEREVISSRTKAALQAKKAQGFTLGKPENLTKEAATKGNLMWQKKSASNENNRRAITMIKALKEDGMNWLRIAYELNRNGFKTSQGKEFQAIQVQRLYSRVD